MNTRSGNGKSRRSRRFYHAKRSMGHAVLESTRTAHEAPSHSVRLYGGRKRMWETQSVLLSVDRFPTESSAKGWVIAHDFKTKFRGKGADVSPEGTFWHFRQHDPGRYKGFRTMVLDDGIEYIRGWI